MKIERYWVDVNAKINYPIKALLAEVAETSSVMSDSVGKTAVSQFVCRVATVGINRHMAAYNNHRIPGRGIPNELARRGDQPPLMVPNVIPSTEDATEAYPGSLQTTYPDWYMEILPVLMQGRDELYRNNRICSDDELFTAVVNGDDETFISHLQMFIKATRDCCPSTHGHS